MSAKKYYWRKSYEMGDGYHWALCDSGTDAEGPPSRVSCLEMVLMDTCTHDLDKRPMPQLIVELLNSQDIEKSKLIADIRILNERLAERTQAYEAKDAAQLARIRELEAMLAAKI